MHLSSLALGHCFVMSSSWESSLTLLSSRVHRCITLHLTLFLPLSFTVLFYSLAFIRPPITAISIHYSSMFISFYGSSSLAIIHFYSPYFPTVLSPLAEIHRRAPRPIIFISPFTALLPRHSLPPFPFISPLASTHPCSPPRAAPFIKRSPSLVTTTSSHHRIIVVRQSSSASSPPVTVSRRPQSLSLIASRMPLRVPPSPGQPSPSCRRGNHRPVGEGSVYPLPGRAR